MAAGTIAPAVADPLVSLFNRTFGTNVQQPSEALGQLLTRMGVPVPRSGAEKFAGQMTAGVTAGTALPAQLGRTAAASSPPSPRRCELQAWGQQVVQRWVSALVLA
jgi:hypothetical protein